MKIKLTQNKYVLMDKKDFDLVKDYKWYYAKNGYAAAKLYFGRKAGKNIQKGIFMHRVIMTPKNGMDVDHINKDKLDNRRANLRICNRSQNLANKFDLNKNTTGYKGVFFVKWGKRIKRWKAAIQIENSQKHLGYFLTKEDAALAYNKAAKQYFGEFAYLNQIGGII